MSYRNPARIVDTQSGQHFRNMQQSLAKSFQGVIDKDTARIEANAVRLLKEQAAIKKGIQEEEADLEKTAFQINKKHGTAVQYDMQEHLRKNAYLSSKPPGSLTPEDRRYQQNFNHMGLSIEQTLSNITSGKEKFGQQLSVTPGKEGSIPATEDNNKKTLALNIWLYGKGGTSHAKWNGETNETTIIAKNYKGEIVGQVTGGDNMYELSTVVVTDKDRKSNVDNLIKSKEKEGIQSSVYGKNPKSDPYTDRATGKTYYMIKPDEAATKAALRVSSLATVQSWTPDQQMNWYNSTQRGKKGFEAISEKNIWTEDEKYKEVPDGEGTKMVPNDNVNKITDALNNWTFENNKQVLLAGKQISEQAFKELDKEKSDSEIKAEKTRKDKITAYNDAKKFMAENKDDLSLKGGISGYGTEKQITKIGYYAGNLNIGIKVSPLKIGDEEEASGIEIKGPGGTFTYGRGSTDKQIREAILKAAVKNPDVSDNKEGEGKKDAFGNKIY